MREALGPPLFLSTTETITRKRGAPMPTRRTLPTTRPSLFRIGWTWIRIGFVAAQRKPARVEGDGEGSRGADGGPGREPRRAGGERRRTEDGHADDNKRRHSCHLLRLYAPFLARAGLDEQTPRAGPSRGREGEPEASEPRRFAPKRRPRPRVVERRREEPDRVR